MGTAHLDRWLGGRLQEGAAGGLRRGWHSPHRGPGCRGSVREVPEWRAVTGGCVERWVRWPAARLHWTCWAMAPEFGFYSE